MFSRSETGLSGITRAEPAASPESAVHDGDSLVVDVARKTSATGGTETDLWSSAPKPCPKPTSRAPSHSRKPRPSTLWPPRRRGTHRRDRPPAARQGVNPSYECGGDCLVPRPLIGLVTCPTLRSIGRIKIRSSSDKRAGNVFNGISGKSVSGADPMPCAKQTEPYQSCDPRRGAGQPLRSVGRRPSRTVPHSCLARSADMLRPAGQRRLGRGIEQPLRMTGGPDGEARRDVAHSHPSRLRASRSLAARTDRMTVTLVVEDTGWRRPACAGSFSGGANGCGNRRRARRVFRAEPGIPDECPEDA